MELILFLITGAVAGWIAGVLMNGSGFGLLGDLVIGIIGAFIGRWLFSWLGFSFGGLFGLLITAVSGAIVLIFVVGLVSRR